MTPPSAGAPTATDDSYQTQEDVSLSIDAVTGVLSNDTDPIDPLQALLVDDVSNGALTLSSDGSFTYAPNADFNGQDAFTYRANDGASSSNLATVTLLVEAQNDAPFAQDDAYGTQEGGSLSVDAANGVLSNDTDPEADALQAILVDDVGNGVLTLNADGSFDYAPDDGFSGLDDFRYLANDTDLDSRPGERGHLCVRFRRARKRLSSFRSTRARG